MSNFRNGIDNLLESRELLDQLHGQRVALIGHPASLTNAGQHSLDALVDAGINVVKAFGPQHGMRGDKQDNMVETADEVDALHGIPVISLYGEHRRPTTEMMADVDVFLFDLQDVGCRIYTYITTLRYFVEACSASGQALWVLDRPNPAGRPVDGLYLESGEESFVGCDTLPTRHGLTVGELSHWFARDMKHDPCTVVPMQGWQPEGPGLGWPIGQVWVNPSPNAPSVNMTRCFPGTVLLEGTTLSEGRGTTTPLSVIGAPDIDFRSVWEAVSARHPALTTATLTRPCWFEPTFHKHQGELCAALQFHTDHLSYNHDAFAPYSLIALLLKEIRRQYPDYELWRHHEYEYEFDRVPIDVINGGSWLREWVDDADRDDAVLIEGIEAARSQWLSDRAPYLRY